MRSAQAADGVLLVADDQNGYVLHVSTLGDLLPEQANVAEALQVGQVEDEYVGVGIAQPVAAEVAPLDVAVEGEMRNGGHVGDPQLVDALVEYRRRVVDALRLRRPVLVREVVPYELLQKCKMQRRTNQPTRIRAFAWNSHRGLMGSAGGARKIPGIEVPNTRVRSTSIRPWHRSRL